MADIAVAQPRRVPIVAWAFASAAAALLAVAIVAFAWRRAQQPPLPVYGHVPAFTLTDQQGRVLSNDMLDGRIWVASFIFTRCAGQCPMMTSAMADLARTLPADGRVQLVSFTVDPEHDTPAELARYAAAYHAPQQLWRFATGPRSIIEELCRDAFHVALSVDGGSPAEPITHSSRLAVVDGHGDIRGYFDPSDAGELRALRTVVQRLSRHTT